MTAKGESVFTVDGDTGEAVRFAFKPLAPGEVDAEIDFSKAKVKRAESSGAYRVSYAARILNSGKDGKKDRLVFSDFHLTLKPGKDGIVMWRRANQLLGLCNAIGVDFKKTFEGVLTIDVEHPETGEVFTQMHPKQVLSKLQELGTVTVKMRIGIKRMQDGQGQNDVQFFISNKKSNDKYLDLDEPNKESVTDISSDAELKPLK